MAAYLLKPIRLAELRDTLAKVLGSRQPSDGARLLKSGAPPPAAAPAPSLLILVAEDNAVNQRLILRLLEKRGHRVKLASHGCEALQLFAQDPFDLAFMDIQMPEMDGLSATAEIRKLERNCGSSRHLPIIALTAHAMKGDQERFLAAGMDGYLSKPLRPWELDDILARFTPSAQNSSVGRASSEVEPTPH